MNEFTKKLIKALDLAEFELADYESRPTYGHVTMGSVKILLYNNLNGKYAVYCYLNNETFYPADTNNIISKMVHMYDRARTKATQAFRRSQELMEIEAMKELDRWMD